MSFIAPANPLKEKMDAGQAVLGTFVKLVDPAVSEILALCGFDFLLFDMEHAPIDIRSLDNMTRACLLGGSIPIARLETGRPEVILRAMDLGLYGVQIPHVETVEDARNVVASIRYIPPLGRRGFSMSPRAAGYGTLSAESYIDWVEKQTLAIIQIESLEAYENLDAILEVDPVDVVFFGPADLSQSAGVPGNIRAPEVQRILEEAPAIIRRQGEKHPGIWVNSPEEVQHFVALGYRYIVLGTDTGFLRSGVRKHLDILKV